MPRFRAAAAMLPLAAATALMIIASECARSVLADQVGRGRFAGMTARAPGEEAFSWAQTARETRALYARVLN